MNFPTTDQSDQKDVYDQDKYSIIPSMTIKVPFYPSIALQRIVIPKGLLTERE